MVESDNKENDKIMIIAGEVSGDLIGAALVKQLKLLSPQMKIFGIGGDKMKSEGMNVLYHIKDMAFLGFTEVVKHLPFIKKVQRELIALAENENLKTVVLLDYPGFNLSIAKKFKKNGMKIVYYVSPQIWAWGSGRMKKVKNLIDKMLVVFPFEESLYKKNNVNTEFVGHPLVERVNDYNFMERQKFFEKFDIKKEIILLMPGSRKHEIENLFPPMINAAIKLSEKFNLQTVVAASSNIGKELFRKISDAENYKIIEGYTYELMKYAKFGIVKSGTSTLEAGYFALPMIIVYKTSLTTYLIGSRLIKLNNIGMANIILGKQVVPELIQHSVTEEEIYKESFEILSSVDKYSSIRSALSGIKNKLGTPGASERAAKSILALMHET